MASLKKRILVFSDFDGIRNIIVKALTTKGYEVTEATTLEDAKNYLNGTGYGLIITDNDTRNGAAYQIINHMRNITNYLYTPVMLLHSHSKEMVAEKYNNLNIGCYLNKPFDMQQFHNIVSRIA